MNIRSIRGAIDVPENTEEAILGRCRYLFEAMLESNEVDLEDVSAIFFTATKDLDAAYPARVARSMGFTSTSLMCMQEMYVSDSMEKCLRIMILWNTEKRQREIKHIYLGKAAQLRPEFNGDSIGGLES